MSLKTSLTFYKLSTVVLLSATFALGVKYYGSLEKYKALKKESKLDKETYVNDLKEILGRYDAEIQKNKDLLKSKGISISEKVIKKNNSYTVIEKIIPIKNFNNPYLVKIDSFESLIRKQNEEKHGLNYQITSLQEKNKELNKKNFENETIISTSKNLTATNIYANGIKIVSNNIIETRRFKAMQQIKICFTLLENRSAVRGNKDIYIQIVNPEGKIVSKNGEIFEAKEKLLRYSTKTNVFYNNEELDVCVFVDPNKNDMTKGDYEINIYSGINLIGNSIFSLK